MGLNNPLPSSMQDECSKCAKILASFLDSSKSFGPDKFIPSQVLQNAKGLAILSVFKAGFLGSARYGNGVVVARLSDGTWSAPSAIGTAGAGFGGQIGFELTDFVFILNDRAAVRTFSQAGTLTLGGNFSVAAGPLGRNAEAAGAASLKGVSGIFSYSKTRGLFAGISLEGSAIVERRDANERIYGQRITANQILTGSIPSPPAAQSLINILNSKFFAGVEKEPVCIERSTSAFDNENSDVPSELRLKNGFGENLRKFRSNRSTNGDSEIKHSPRSVRGFENYLSDSTSNQNQFSGNSRKSTSEFSDSYVYSDNPRPSDNFRKRSADKFNPHDSMVGSSPKNQAVAKFSFKAGEPGDLTFRKGDIITITQSSNTKDDWWTGTIGNQIGIFPANYVEMIH